MQKRKLRVISTFLATVGFIFVFISVYPIIEYEYVSRKRFPRLASPIPEEERYKLLTASVKDFSKLENWSTEYEILERTPVREKYHISIPKLKIKDAEVSEGGEDLSKSLIQYPGTVRPGQAGNSVIFGHSVLPIFFNPKNYMSIFSTIPKLKKGDEIFVNIENIEYKYKVTEMFEVQPDNLDILDQKLNNSYLSLVTCVPPGHPLKPRRLVVKAILSDI